MRGGTLINSNGYNSIAALYLNGGTLNAAGGANGLSFALRGNVSVNGGTNTSVITGSYGGVNLGGYDLTGTTFNVASGGTASGIDLLVSTALVNGTIRGSWPNQQASYLTKTGAGLMLLSGTNSYTGATTVGGGTLRAGSMQAYGVNSAVTLSNVAGVVMDLNGFNNSVGSLAGGGVTGGNVTLGSGTLTSGGNNTSTSYGGVISGTGGLTKTGSGNMTLTGSNSYSGLTRITQGLLILSNASGPALYNGVGSGTVSMNNSTSGGFGVEFGATNQLGSKVAVSFDGTGTWNYFKLMGYNQTIGSLIGSNSGYGVIENTENTTAGAATLTVVQTTNGTFSGYLRNTASGSGALALTKQGTATLTLSGANITYTGDTTVNEGRLIASNTTAFTSSVNIASNAVMEFALSGANLYLNGDALTGAGTLVKSGSGILILGVQGSSQTLAFSPGAWIDVQGGTLMNEWLNTGWTSNKASMNIASGATLDLWDGNITIDALMGSGTVSKGPVGTQTFTLGVANGSGTFSGQIKNPSGTVNLLKSGSGTQVLSGTNSYTGATTVGGGTLRAGSMQAYGVNSAVTLSNVAGVVMDLNGFNNTIDSLSGGGITGGNVTLGAGTLTMGAAGGSGTFSGTITGTGGLVKAGAGSEGLTASNSFSGGVRVNAGTLGLGDNSALGTGTLTMASNNAILLALSNNLTITNPITLLGNEYFDSGSYTITYNGLVSGAGAVYVQGSGTVVFATNNIYSGGTFLNAGTLSFGLPGAIGGGTLTFQSNAAVAATAGMTITNRVVINSGVTGSFNYGTNTVTNSGAIMGAGNFLKLGIGSLSLTASNTFTGTLQVNAGSVDFGTNGSITSSSVYLGYNAGDAGVMRVESGNTLTISSSTGMIIGYNGSGALYQSGGLSLTPSPRSPICRPATRWFMQAIASPCTPSTMHSVL